MLIKGIVNEDFVNYRKPCMYICTATCSFKCDKESGVNCCQNSSLASEDTTEIPDDVIIEKYLSNPITKSICFSGLEPFDQTDELLDFIAKLRYQYHCNDDVVIYTGYNKEEVSNALSSMKNLGNLVVKFGRYIPDQRGHFDDVLGVNLASDNQFAERF